LRGAQRLPGCLDDGGGLTNNGSVVRKALAVALSLAIQVAALSAPFVHAHPDQHATAHHDGSAIHSHWGGHGHKSDHPDGPGLSGPDEDRAVFMAAFVAVTAGAARTVAVVESPFVPPTPTELAAHRSVEIAHGHDPPALRSLPSRAPPAFLS
jgi:hypothetical protein